LALCLNVYQFTTWVLISNKGGKLPNLVRIVLKIRMTTDKGIKMYITKVTRVPRVTIVKKSIVKKC